MKINFWLVCCIAMLACMGCRTRDVRTAFVFVPDMKNEICRQIVVDAVTRCHGVLASTIRTDMSMRTLTVDYESMVTALKNIEFVIAEAGFKANQVPANAEAAKALPPGCL